MVLLLPDVELRVLLFIFVSQRPGLHASLKNKSADSPKLNVAAQKPPTFGVPCWPPSCSTQARTQPAYRFDRRRKERGMAGKTDKAKGRVKEAAGALTGNR